MTITDEHAEQSAPEPEADPAKTADSRSLSAWRAATAALLVVGATSTAVQLVTALSLGTAQYFDWRWSTGGVLAIAAAIFMAFKGTSWVLWRRRIWPWLVATALIAAIAMFAQSSAITADQALPDSPTFGLASHWTKIDADAKYGPEEQPTGKVLVDYSGIKNCYLGQPWHECIDDIVEDYERACVDVELSPKTPKYLYEAHDGAVLNVCEATLRTIQTMQQEGGAGWVVTSVGTEKLTVTEETGLELVLKEPERTHVAICYLGLLGECS